MKPSFNNGVWRMDLELSDSRPEEKKLLCAARVSRQQQGENGRVVVSETSSYGEFCQIKWQETMNSEKLKVI